MKGGAAAFGIMVRRARPPVSHLSHALEWMWVLAACRARPLLSWSACTGDVSDVRLFRV